MWSRAKAAIFLLAAIVTIMSGLIVAHQYLASPQGKWLSDWVSEKTLTAFVLFVLLGLPWLAIWFSWKSVSDSVSDVSKGINSIQSRTTKLEERIAKVAPELGDIAE